MTQAEMHQAAGLGPDWHVMWSGADPFDTMQHLCGSLTGPGGTHHSDWVQLPYAPTATPGIEVARCERCRAAWVRAVEG